MLVTPHAPMQEMRPPTQQNFCAVPIISAFLLIYKGDLPLWVCVLSGCAGITYNLHGPFVRPAEATAHGGRECPTPTGRSAGETRHTNQFL